MGAETIGLLVVVGVIVAVLALYLITIGLALTRLNRTLGSIVAGLTIIRDRTAPVGAVLGDIVTDVDAIENNLHALLGAVGGAPAEPVVASMGDAVAQARGGRGRSAKRAAGPSGRERGAGSSPASMEEAVARAREAAPASESEPGSDGRVAAASVAQPVSAAYHSSAQQATGRTPRPAGQAARPRPSRRSTRSKAPALESSPPARRSSGRSAGRRKQLALGSGSPSNPAAKATGNGAGSSSMKEAVARAREKAGAR